MEEHFIEIENIIGASRTIEELKEAKLAYIKEHRYVLEYFNFIQKELEEETYG